MNQRQADAAFPVANRLIEASSHAERAAILLQLSDAALLARPFELGRACAAVGFVDGQCFVAVRAALLCHTRDAHGLLPEREAAELEQLRLGLSHLAAGAA